ncbi:MAG: DUF4835 family protein [Chlorobi bacterium]|nr:DUF4835 family protein [Chlorobiota bacterium]
MRKIVLFLMFLPFLINAQELDATVSVNFEQLPTQVKDQVRNFESAISDYLNNTQFTEDTWEWDKITCHFNIFFTSGSATSYSAQVVITSQRSVEGSQKKSLMLNIMDPIWNFTYEDGQSMYFKQSDFDPFLSFLDFYAYLIIGFDSDSYDPLGGNPWFSKALELTARGASSQSKQGWEYKSSSYNKRALVDDLMNANYQQFREDYFDYHFNGLDLYAKDKKTAQANIVKLINDLNQRRGQINPRSVLLRVFFNAKAGEIVDYLKDYPDKSIFETLIRIDTANTTKYREAMEGK